MVRMPPASAAGGPAVALIGSSGRPMGGGEAGWSCGSRAMEWLYGYPCVPRKARAVDTRLFQFELRLISRALGQILIGRQIAEPGDVGFELDLHGAGGSVTLLTDDKLGFAGNQIHLGLPF